MNDIRKEQHVSIDREMMVDIGGKNYTITSDDIYLEGIKNGFEPQMVDLFRSVASDSEVILDVGANIGCTALLFGELSKVVYAFEPSPTTFALLEKNISRSGLKNVFSLNMGLGAEPGESTLTFAPSNRSGGFVSNKIQASAGHIVEKIVIRQMDEVLKSLSVSWVDFIKIDVEGFEGHVLRGAKQTLAAYKPVVVLELNHRALNVFQRISIPDFFDLLRSIFPILLAVDGLRYLNLHDESESYIVMHQQILHRRFPDILAAFDESRLNRFRSLYRNEFVVTSNKNIQGNIPIPIEVPEKTSVSVTKNTPFQFVYQKIENWGGNIDSIDNQSLEGPVVKVTSSQIRIMGWFADAVQGISPAKAAFYFNSGTETYYAEISFNSLRPDIAEAFKNKNLTISGFNVLVDISTLPPGRYEIGFLGQSKNDVGKFEPGIYIENSSEKTTELISPKKQLESNRNVKRVAGIALLELILVLAIETVALRLWRIDFSVPFNYWGDTLQFVVPIKGMIENGWTFEIPQLSAPFGLSAVAFPAMTNLDWLIMKAISLFASDAGTVLNTFWLFSIVLTAWSATLSLRLIGVKDWLALGFGVVYSFLPFVLLRNVCPYFVDVLLCPLSNFIGHIFCTGL